MALTKTNFKLSLKKDLSALCITMIKSKNEQTLTQKEETYTLRPITLEEIFELRKGSKPGIIIESKGSYFYAPIPRSLNCSSANILGKYLCVSCARFSAKADCDGGCEKVRDADIREYRMRGYTENEAVQLSKRLEKYKFITEGYEAFNTASESLVITKCEHYHRV